MPANRHRQKTTVEISGGRIPREVLEPGDGLIALRIKRLGQRTKPHRIRVAFDEQGELAVKAPAGDRPDLLHRERDGSGLIIPNVGAVRVEGGRLRQGISAQQIFLESTQRHPKGNPVGIQRRERRLHFGQREHIATAGRRHRPGRGEVHRQRLHGQRDILVGGRDQAQTERACVDQIELCVIERYRFRSHRNHPRAVDGDVELIELRRKRARVLGVR
jgi:hypothetical protein